MKTKTEIYGKRGEQEKDWYFIETLDKSDNGVVLQRIKSLVDKKITQFKVFKTVEIYIFPE